MTPVALAWPCDVVCVTANVSSMQLRLTFAEGSRPYVARITGPDPTYRWARTFLKLTPLVTPSTEFARQGVSVIRFTALGGFPVALDVRWGPRVPQDVPRCALQGYFLATVAPPYLQRVDEASVHRFMTENILPALVVSTAVRRTRAPITFDEMEV